MAPKSSARRRPVVLRYLGYAASAGIVGWLLFVVLPAIGDLDEAGELLLAHLRVPDVLLAAGLLVLYLLTHALTLTTAAPKVSLGTAALVRAVAGAVGRFVPAGWAAGTGVFATMLHARGLRTPAITHAIAVTSVWNAVTKLALPLLGLVAVALLGAEPLPESGLVAAAAFGGLLLVALGLGLLERKGTARRVAGWVERPLAALARRRDRSPPQDLTAHVLELQASTAQALRDRPLRMALWYMAHHLAQVALIWTGMRVAARAAGLETGLPEVLLAFAIGYLLTGLPISPGGLGTMDVAVVAVLTALGETAAVASAGLLVYRVTTYALYAVALGSWPLWRARARAREQHPAKRP